MPNIFCDFDTFRDFLSVDANLATLDWQFQNLPQRKEIESAWSRLAREICTSIKNYESEFCGINATGGYKAQIAIAVTIGQAARVPVYDKHELFNDITSFPPCQLLLIFLCG